MIDFIESDYSRNDHRKVVRKKPDSKRILSDMDSLIERLMINGKKPMEKVISQVKEDIISLRKGLSEGKPFNADKLVNFLQTYGQKLKVSNDISEIAGEIELEEARGWLNARIFTSSQAWSNLSTDVLIDLRAQVASRLYTSLLNPSQEILDKEVELIRIADYWLKKANFRDSRVPGLARANKQKFAGIGVGDLNQHYADLAKEPLEAEKEEEDSCTDKTNWDADADTMKDLSDDLQFLLSKVKNDENSESIADMILTKEQIARSVTELMRRITEGGVSTTEEDIVNLMGVAFFWLAFFFGILRGSWTTLLLAPVFSFVPMIYGKIENNRGFGEIYNAIGFGIFFENQRKAVTWLMDCVIVRITFIVIAIAVRHIADQYKLLHNDEFLLLWDKLNHYASILQRNCMVYCGKGRYFPIQSKVEGEQVTLSRNGIFYLNGVRYVQMGGPVRRVQVLRIRHRKTGINRHKKSISSEVEDINGNVYVDRTEMISFRQIAKEMLLIIVNAAGGEIKPRINPDYYADLVNRWKGWS